MSAPDLTPEERAEVVRFGVHEPEIIDEMEAALNGATDPGDPAAWASNPGEFAARYNSWTPERRHAWAERIIRDSMRAARCREAGHDEEIDRLRSALLDVTFVREVSSAPLQRPVGESSTHVTTPVSFGNPDASDGRVACPECRVGGHQICSHLGGVDAFDNIIDCQCGCEPSRTCPNCSDVMPVGWTLENHLDCHHEEDA